jgi:maltokinase
MTREHALASFLSEARWFSGKGRAFEVGDVRELGLGLTLVDVRYDDGGVEVYQVPLASYDEPQERLSHAFVGAWDGAYFYDAAHDREAADRWLLAFDSAGHRADRVEGADGVRFHRLPGHDLDLEAHSTLFSGEQSNSSLAFGEDSLLKLFRRITPGLNPDVEIHRALTEAGSTHVAHLYGWIEADGGDEPLQLGMLQQFLRTSTEGWSLALGSVRVLFSEGVVDAEDMGGDFASEAQLLGTAVAEVHQVLREQFGSSVRDAADLAAWMHRRLDETIRAVPEVAAYADHARETYERLAQLGRVETQRVHGDLHLGQTLRTSLGWKLVDFEGEPAKPLRERRAPDSRWRDVAGMLRSFDYAAHTVDRDLLVDDEARAQIGLRAAEWTARNRDAFRQGYVEASAPMGETEQVLLAAYETDKAVYEVAYEARNRPSWVDIPLSALAHAEDRPV